jgi:hypothetical protein
LFQVSLQTLFARHRFEIGRKIEDGPGPLAYQFPGSFFVLFSFFGVFVQVHHSFAIPECFNVDWSTLGKLVQKQNYFSCLSLCMLPPYVCQKFSKSLLSLEGRAWNGQASGQPIGEHTEDVVFYECELQVVLLQLGHHFV